MAGLDTIAGMSQAPGGPGGRLFNTGNPYAPAGDPSGYYIPAYSQTGNTWGGATAGAADKAPGTTPGGEQKGQGTVSGGGGGANDGSPNITNRAAVTSGTGNPGQAFQAFLQLLSQFMGGGQGNAFSPVNVPDYMTSAMRAAQLARDRAGQNQANEAAATGSAGSRDLANRQSLLDESLFNASGNIGAEQSGRQFTSNLQAQQLQAQQQIAQFNQMLRLLTALGGMGGVR